MTLTIARAASHDETVGVFYTAPGGQNATPLRDLSGNKVANILGQKVTNNTPPVFSRASVDGATLWITFSGDLDTGSVPAAAAFTVTVDGTDRTPTAAAFRLRYEPSVVQPHQVELTLDPAVVRGQQTVTVAYTAPMTDPLRDADQAMLPVPGFTGQSVTNNTALDQTAPTFVSAAVEGNKLAVKFSEPLDENSVPAANRFKYTVGSGGDQDPTGIGVEGDTVTLTLGDAVARGDVVRVRYFHTGTDPIQDLAGNDLATFQLQAVTNNTVPAFSSASVNGATLTVTFDGALDANSVPAKDAFEVKVTRFGTERDVDLAATNPVSIAGSAVTLTLAEAVVSIDPVTVGYTAPGTDPLRDAANAMLPVPGFSGETVTNDTPADSTGPAFVSATTNGRTVTITFDEALDESVTLVRTVFHRRLGGGLAVSSTSASISERTVTLAFGSSATHGQAVTISYDQPPDAARRLKDLSGNEAARIWPPRAITNNTPPAFSSASVNGATLTVTFDGALDTSSVPAKAAFEVKATRSGDGEGRGAGGKPARSRSPARR